MSHQDEKYFDVRTMHRYLKKGVVKQEEINAHLKALPNDEDNFELTVFENDDLDLPLEDEEE